MVDSEAVESPAELHLPTVRASVGVGPGGTPLAEVAQELMVRAVVDNHLHQPGMFELTFRDLEGDVLSEAGLKIGSQVTVGGTSIGGVAATLITGEVTAIEGSMYGMTAFTTVRGYTLAHRLQRARHSRTFLNITDADVARQVATEAGLPCGGVVESKVTHAYLAQVNQTDAEFLADRALELGYETGFANGQFYFRPSTTVDTPVSSAPEPLVFRENLISFQPRVSAANLTPDVEVRVWDPMQAMAFAAPGSTPAGGPLSPSGLGRQFTEPGTVGAGGSGGGSGLLGTLENSAINLGKSVVDGALGGGMGGGMNMAESVAQGALGGAASDLLGGSSPLGGLGSLLGGANAPLGPGSLGPPPSRTAHVVTDRPLADATSMQTAGLAAAGALASDLGSTFAEADGDTIGDPAIQPGAVVEVDNVQSTFAGRWLISHARHVFDDREHGYHTVFSAHGREDRSVVGLASRARAGRRAVIDGVVCGVVSNNLDPLGRARVKAVLPWLSPDFETDWAPAAQINAGTNTGALFVPEVGSEVLVAFEQGDPRRPYVVGSVVNQHAAWSLNTMGPMAALTSLASGLGGIGGQIASFAGGLENVVDTVSKLTPLGQAVGATGLGGPMMSGGMPSTSDMEQLGEFVGLSAIPVAGPALGMASLDGPPGSVPGMPGGGGQASGGAAGGLPGIPGMGGMGGMMAPASMGAVQQAPGMVGEVVRTGFVTGTGNALVFNDQPALAALGLEPQGGGAMPGGDLLGDALGTAMPGAGSGSGSSPLTSMMGGANAAADGGPPLASSITLGNRMGNHGLYIDQVTSMVILQAGATPGVSASPMPTLVITTGPEGNVIINGGASLTLAAEGTISMIAPEITIAGETITVAGELIPLTPG